MSKAEVKRIIVRIGRLKAKVAKDRDEIRDLVSDLQELEEDCDGAATELECAADSLSRTL